MTTVIPLPAEILARIIYEQLCIEDLPECLKLRLVSRYFDQEVLRVLNDLGLFDKRFYRQLRYYSTVHDHFALHYLEAFIRNARKENSKTKHRTQRRRKPHPALSESSSTSSSGGSDGDSVGSSYAAGPGRGHRVEWLQSLFTSAMVLLMSNTSSQHEESPASDSSTIAPPADDEQLWGTWTRDICNALIALLGARNSLIFVGPSRILTDIMDGNGRHLTGKSAEFYALIAAVHSQNFSLSSKWIEQFRIGHRRTQRWLRRLDSDWQHFAWNSTKREKVWLEVLAACLTIAVKRGDSTLFDYLINLEPGIFTPAFTYIRYNERNLFEEVIASQRLDYFHILADKGWCLAKQEQNDFNLHDQYTGALIAALKLSSALPQRFEMLRVILIMSQDWQRNNNFRRLLLQAAEDNDVKLATLMLDLLSEEPIKWPARDAATYERGSRFTEDRDALDVAELNGSSEMVQFLLRNRRQIKASIVESWAYINPKRAVGQIIKRGEPTDMKCFKEIVYAARNTYLGHHFVQAAAHLSTETLAILAEHVDLEALDDEDEIIVIEESIPSIRRSSVYSVNTVDSTDSRSRSPTSRTSASSRRYRRTINSSVVTEDDRTRPTRGECALASALRTLNWKNARFLVEELGVKLSWGSIKGIDVWETNETGMKALDELRKLLAEHGMSMETKLIYAPVFHPGEAASTTKLKEHEVDNVELIESVHSSNSSRSRVLIEEI